MPCHTGPVSSSYVRKGKKNETKKRTPLERGKTKKKTLILERKNEKKKKIMPLWRGKAKREKKASCLFRQEKSRLGRGAAKWARAKLLIVTLYLLQLGMVLRHSSQ